MLIILFRYVTKKSAESEGTGSVSTGYAAVGEKQHVLPFSMEEDLAKQLATLADMFYGVSVEQCRKMAYTMAVANKIDIPSNWKDLEIAGYDWYLGFRKRHKLSIRTPEATSMARATAFNKTTVKEFFDNLVQVNNKHAFPPERIFNMDETGCTTVQKPKQVLARQGQKQVGSITTAEWGELTTVVCTVSASGNHLPPMFIFPRVNMQHHFRFGGMPGAKGCASKSGWMTVEIFAEEYLDHLISHSNCTKENPILLILDNHGSHVSIQAVQKAKDNGITLLTIPPHTSHKLQPLDISVYGPFKGYFNRAMDDWMRNNPGQLVRIGNMSQLVKYAMLNSMTPRNIIAGFEKAGIYPINTEVFQDSDFAAAELTNRPDPAIEHQPEIEEQPTTSEVIAIRHDATPSSSGGQRSGNYVSPSDLFPPPKAPPRKPTSKGRKRGKTMVLTDTPVKEALEQAARERAMPKTKPKRKKIQLPAQASDSETEADTPPLTDEEEDVDEPKRKCKVGDYVLVKVAGKKPNIFKKFVAVVTMVESNGDLFVSYLRRVSGCTFNSAADDEGWVEDKDVVEELPQPTIDNRGLIKFARAPRCDG